MSEEVFGAERAVYTVAEVAVILGLSERLAYEMVRTGQIPSLHLGRRKVVVPKRVIEEMLTPATPATPATAANDGPLSSQQ